LPDRTVDFVAPLLPIAEDAVLPVAESLPLFCNRKQNKKVDIELVGKFITSSGPVVFPSGSSFDFDLVTVPV
jgi:hypothetical protein